MRIPLRCASLQLAAWLGLAACTPSSGPVDATFLLETDDPTYRVPGHFGNGVFSVLTTPLGTTPAPSFMIGVYDHAEGDIPRIAVIPAWNEVDIVATGRRLNATEPMPNALAGYRQVLDLHDGVLRTQYEWVAGDRRVAVAVETLVSRADPHVAAVRLRVTPRASERLSVVFPLRAWPAPDRLPLVRLETIERDWGPEELWYPGHTVVTERSAEPLPARPRASLSGRTEGRGTVVVEAMVVVASGNVHDADVRDLVAADATGVALEFDARAGEEYVFDKLVGVASSWNDSAPLETARAAADAAVERGYDALLDAHERAWHRLWETDIVLEGAPELQRVVRSMIFHLLSGAREGTDFGIPPMGLSGAGYYGHIFWDADTYMFPPLLVLHPDIARSLVGFRVRTLEAARAKARQHGYEGAMYPWEADERGEETTPKFAEQNALMEIHIVGDVAIAQWQYFLATADTTYLAERADPVLRATADFWVSRVSYDPARDRYGTERLVSVHEGLIGIHNDTYTNAIARQNLRIAARASRILGREPNPEWERVAEKMHIPFDEARQAHPTYEGAPEETLGEVVPLLSYPLGLEMSDEVKRNNLRAAVRKFEARGGGAMMGSSFYPLLAAELADREMFDRLVPKSYQPWLRGPYLALSETPRTDAVNFVTGAGAFLQQVIFGYTGLRIGEDGLTPRFAPMLPAGVRRLVLRNVSVRGRRFDIVVEGGRLEPIARER